ncbi:vWA domain-containing protein [Tenggerimyces flavus]|uniref:VWFA domain-containing protein n=1 Tax=Tenggerimyces flavus TaxID=1708749 RepID=A0ABV7YBL2_9ACTN|nr:hypothetical protein [Tenggerimyces flavus]MBM7785483.1 hypothetical protein [Tenggerimyces flavus]
MTRLRSRVAAAAIAILAVAFSAGVPAFAQTPQASKLRVVSVLADGQRNVSLVLRLDADSPTPVPTTVFTVSPRAKNDPVKVSRRGAQGLDLMLVYSTSTPDAVVRGVRTASAELLLRVPSGSRVGVAGSTDDVLSTDTAATVLALDRVRTDRTIEELLTEGLTLFEHSPKVAGRNPSLILFDVGPYPYTAETIRPIQARAVANDVAIYVVRLKDGRTPNKVLDELAAKTGGTVSVADDPSQLGAAAGHALADAQSRYDLRFKLPEPAPEQVQVTAKRGDVTTSTTVALPASVSRAVEVDVPPDTVTLVVMAGAIGTVMLFGVFARIWVGLQHPDE